MRRHDFDRHSGCLLLFREFLDKPGLRFVLRDDEIAEYQVFDIHAEFGGQRRVQPLTRHREIKREAWLLGRHRDHAGIDAGSAATDCRALDDGDLRALLCQVVSHRAADDAAAYDCNV